MRRSLERDLPSNCPQVCVDSVSRPDLATWLTHPFFFDRFGYITLCNKTFCIFLRPQRDFYLTLGCSYIHSAVNDIHPSSCVYNYYQLGADNPRSAVLLELVHQIIKESCFDQLRWELTQDFSQIWFHCVFSLLFIWCSYYNNHWVTRVNQANQQFLLVDYMQN